MNIQWDNEMPFHWYKQPAISCREFAIITISYYKSFTVNKQKSVYKGYLSIYVPSIDIMCTIISHWRIINGLAQVPFEGVLVEAYKGTSRKHNMKF